MKTRSSRVALCAAAGVAMAGLLSAARATISIDGSLDSDYGNPLAIQTNATGFGKSSDSSGNSPGGSELDAAYGVIQNGSLNLFFAGNLEGGNSYNHLNIFIADGRPGENTLTAGGSLGSMYGSQFSPGFQATYALDINGGGSPITEYINSYDLTQAAGSNPQGSYLGSFSGNSGTSSTVGNLSVSFNNTNYNLGVAAQPATPGGDGEVETGSNASSGAATLVSTGLEVSIPLANLGGTTGPVEVLADINGGGNNYLSNQFLPGLPTVVGNVGYQGHNLDPASPYTVNNQSGAFNLSGVTNAYFTVAAATGSTAVNGVWNTGSGSWSTAINWTNNALPTSAGDTATFAYNVSAPIVSLNGNHTVGRLTFNSSNGYTIAQGSSPSGGILTIDDTTDIAGVIPQINVLAGSHTISAPMNLASGVTVTAASGATLTVSSTIGGTGDITKTGVGNLNLTGSNTFSGNVNILLGAVEVDNASAVSNLVFIGNGQADGAYASLNLGTAGLTIPQTIITNQDDSGRDDQRAIAATYNSGNGTFSGSLYMDGGVSFYAPSGASLTYSGTINNGQDTASVAKHDVVVNAATGGTIILTNTETYTGATIVNSGTLTLTPSATLVSPTVIVNGGDLNFAGQSSGGFLTRTLAGSLTINSGGLVTVAPATSRSSRQLLVAHGLSFSGSLGAWAGKLDLANNDADIVGGNITNVIDQLHQGYNSATAPWTGQGIISSTAGANTTHLTALGAIVNSTDGATPLYGSGTSLGTFDGASPGATDVLIKYTYVGDANLDGKVDGSDYSRIDNGFSLGLTGWYNGDFNYDGVVNGSDYTLIDNAFNTQSASLADSLASPAAIATAQIAGSATAVPEPTSLALFGMTAAGFLGRRRRQF
jgi:autotransporter-associated beta strand protein